jgi:hypothetical protein
MLSGLPLEENLQELMPIDEVTSIFWTESKYFK